MKTSNTILILVVVVIILVAGYFFISGRQAQSPTSLPSADYNVTLEEPTPTAPTTEEVPINTTSESSIESQNEEYVVVYDGNTYQPETVGIKQGETVTFVNQSDKAMWPASDEHPTHTLYDDTSLSEHCPNTDNTAFDACQGIQPGDSWSFQFHKKGVWEYHDHLNPSATGIIIVE